MNLSAQDQNLVIAHNLSELRVKKYGGHGQAKVCAKEFNITPGLWSGWENGTRPVPQKHLPKLAEFFDVDVNDLTTPPENWPEVRRKMLQALSKKKGKGTAAESMPEEDTAQTNQTTRGGNQQATTEQDGVWLEANPGNFPNVMVHLGRAAEMVANGEITADDYNAVMQEVAVFTDFVLARKKAQRRR